MTQPKPKMSVISTVYNGQEYINRCVDSILGQSYDNFEYILVDDGSTDESKEYLKALAEKDSRIKFFSLQRLGRAKALNYAIQKAQGNYIVNQDIDDISYPERLYLQAKYLDTHPQMGLVGGAYIRVDDERQEKYIRTPETEHNQIIQTMAKCVPFAHTVSTFRKKAWQQAGGYPLADSFIDLRFLLKITKLGWKLGSISNIVGEHWVHSKSYWHQNFKYQSLQRELAEIQWQTIKELKLPLWFSIYPLGRYFYAYFCTDFKRLIRRNLLNIKEENFD